MANEGERTRLCPSCRMEVPLVARTCRFCGESLRPRNSKAPEVPPQEEIESGDALEEGYVPQVGVEGQREGEATYVLGTKASRRPDPVRLCPSCRNLISVLATVCHYCGEQVGRPRMQQRELSVEDLGGETISHVGVSHGVLQAMETFRHAEGGNAEGEDPVSVSKRAEAQLCEDLAALAERVEMSPSFRPQTARRKLWDMLPGWGWAVVLLAFVAGAGAAAYTYWPREEPPPPPPDNPAAAMLASNADLFETLGASARYQRLYGSDTPDPILLEARARVAEHIRGFLDREPYNPEDHRKADALAIEAQRIDPSGPFTAVRKEAAREMRAYNMLLQESGPEADPPTAAIRLMREDRSVAVVDVAQGETFYDGRFKLDGVWKDSVLVIDLKRGGRRLRVSKIAGVMPFE